MPSASFPIDSVIANRRFTVDACILGNRLRHDRGLDHTGTQTTEVVVLSEAIGPYAAGTTVQAVLEGFAARLVALESSDHVFGTFSASAFIPPWFTANSVIKRTMSGGFTADAVITRAFTINAVIFSPVTPAGFTANAFIV